MNQLKIVVIGGGSKGWMPRLGKDLLLTPALAGAHVVLYDINKAASDLTKAFLDKLASQMGVKMKFTSTDRRAKAFEGANYFIITISTGDLDAMAHDLAIPEKFSIFQTVGDTAGPGGWARFIRNFDVFVGLAGDINRYAPGAVVMNYTNPMATLTDVLSRLCTGPVVGLCHGLFENLEFYKKLYKLQSEDEMALRYGGLNHFFWIMSARAGQTDIVADLRRRLAKGSFTNLLRLATPGTKAKREVATELFQLTGMLPYLGDRHTSEFVPWYLRSMDAIAKYKIVRTSIKERRDGHARLYKKLREMVAGEIPKEYFNRSRETAADIINAHSQNKPFIDVGNMPNNGQIANLPRGAVVETAVRVDAHGFSPITVGDLPPVVQGLILPHALGYRMVVDACFRGDKDLAVQALRLDPLCGHLDGQQLTKMANQLLAAHRRFITAF